MKTLHFCNGLTVFIRLSTEEGTHNHHPDKIIAVYYDKAGELIYSVIQGGSMMNRNVVFAEGITELSFNEVLQMAEIIENFDFYFNHLS